ncbi:hypothetical protein Vretifemale_20515 [Volvox reticuliferus]|uniref:Autophagy-related protein 13 N-terminal domain-containing protein n=1 Tax=Volvox reticuliferus TaxID=1737510 RepID=A0A8J4FZN3_9CHLO|nr:hypothetical protein Vretifemale_20515 [Volvox reticuliferus]
MADRLTIEHYIGEAFVKCGQVILGSRILPTGSVQQQPRSARDKRAGRWFLLELEEADGVGKEVELWRKDLSSPLIIEIQMAPGRIAALAAAAAAASTATAGNARLAAAAGGGSSTDGAGVAAVPGDLLFTPLERWTLQYERSPPSGSSSSMAGAGSGACSGSSSTRTYLDEVSVYKRLTILVRSLYSYTRVLPAYKLFRAAKQRYAGGQSQFQLQYRIRRTLQQQAIGDGASGAAHHPGPRMQDFAFAPVDKPPAGAFVSRCSTTRQRQRWFWSIVLGAHGDAVHP